MSLSLSWKNEFIDSIRLAFPLMIAFIGYQLLSLVDTFVAGQIGVQTMAAVSIGSALYWGLSIFPMGVLLGLDPLISQSVGAGEDAKAWHYCLKGLSLILPLSLFFLAILIILTQPSMPWLIKGDEVSRELLGYLQGRALGIPVFLIHTCLRCYLQAYEKTKPILLGIIFANIINLPLSIYLGGGDALWHTFFGLPKLGLLETGWGAFGIGLGSLIVNTSEILVLGIFAIRQAKLPFKLDFEIKEWMSILKIGLPLGGALLCEGGVFSVSTLMMSQWDATIISGHQVTLQLVSFTFTFCLGVSNATSVRVGLGIGEKQFKKALMSGAVGIMLGLMIMSFMAFLFMNFGSFFAGLISSDPKVVEIATKILWIGACFQIFDGTQTICAGALRGAGMTNIPFWAALISYWFLGLPIGLVLAFHYQWSVYGLWWGLCFGLIFAAISLLFKFIQLYRHPEMLHRIEEE
jgi:MATE family multidrug resistance protein